MNANVAELMGEPWCIRQEALEAFIGAVPDRKPATARAQGPFPRLNPLKIEGGVATVTISGVLLKSLPLWAREYEIDATGYDEIAEDLAAAVAHPDVRSIRLLIDSPGGQLSGITDAAAAIEAAGKIKSITADVEDGAYSAAYWLASQAKNIIASPTAGIGSIGTFLTLTDLSALAERLGIKVHLVSSGRHKGVGAGGVRIEHDQLEPFQKFVDQATDMFVAAVAKGRRVSPEAARAWADGRFWMAGEAKEMGLIDAVWSPGAAMGVRGSAAIKAEAVSNQSETLPGVPAAAKDTVSPRGDGTMEQTDLAAAQAKAKGEAVAAERQRLADLKAAFPGEDKFVMEQYEAGSSVLEAKAAFGDVLKARLEAKDKENATLREQAAAPATSTGPAPVANKGTPQSGGGDFMTVAQADQRSHQLVCVERLSGRKAECCGMVKAMSRVSKANPALHAEFLEAQRGRAPQVHQRKVELGLTGPFARA